MQTYDFYSGIKPFLLNKYASYLLNMVYLLFEKDNLYTLTIMENTKALEILKTAILLEKRGKAFYEKMAEQTESPEARKIFTTMAEEEKAHVEFLSVQFANYVKEGKFSKPDYSNGETEDISHEIMNPQLIKEISAASFEAAAISAAMDFETRAVELYSKRSAEAEDPKRKKCINGWRNGKAATIKFCTI
jgi:rubrerythrin